MEHSAEHATEHAGSHEHHVTHPFVYYKTYLILVVLMITTVLAAGVNMGSPAMNNLVAMIIAVTKAVLVVLFFMQVKYSSRLVWLWAAVGFIWLILMFITLQDYISRQWIKIPGW